MTTAIAVLTYNQPDLVKGLASVLDPYLIVIDNCSTVEIPNVNIRVPENRYFSGGWNYAMQEINADWVAMLNDDIEGISTEMIDELVDIADANNFDVISPAMNNGHAHMTPQNKGLKEVPFVDWVAPIIRKSAWDAVKGFNTIFPGYGSDLDIAYRLRKIGYRLAVDDHYVIHHIGGVAAIAAGTQHIQGSVHVMNQALQEVYGIDDWTVFFSKYLDVKYEFTETPEGMQWISMDGEMQLLPKGS